MRISVAKAESLDSIDEGLSQATSSMVRKLFGSHTRRKQDRQDYLGLSRLHHIIRFGNGDQFQRMDKTVIGRYQSGIKKYMFKSVLMTIGHSVSVKPHYHLTITHLSHGPSNADIPPWSFPKVDDVFFIIKKCLRRALSSGSADVTCAMLNHTSAILDEEYHDILKARLNNSAGFAAWANSLLDFNQAYSLVQSSFQQGL